MISSPTVGGTNIAGVYRIFGTIAGCLAAVISWYGSQYWLPIAPFFIFLFAFPSFYVLLNSAYPRIGQVAIMAYSVVFLGKLTADTHTPEASMDILELALKRGISVMTGIVVGLIITWYTIVFLQRSAYH